MSVFCLRLEVHLIKIFFYSFQKLKQLLTIYVHALRCSNLLSFEWLTSQLFFTVSYALAKHKLNLLHLQKPPGINQSKLDWSSASDLLFLPIL
jgi:hypothetical protein